jgi:hypothetical protein
LCCIFAALWPLPPPAAGRYSKAWGILDAAQALQGQTGGALLTADEEGMVLGGTMRKLFPGAWGGYTHAR